MANVEFKDNSMTVKNAIDAAVKGFLHEAGGELSSQAASATAVDSGQLKGSWAYRVNEAEQNVVVGNPMQNSIWEEYGTGIYAEKGNGRKDVPWTYKDAYGNWHRTKGKRPKRTFRKTFEAFKPKVEAVIKSKFGGLG